MNVLGDPMNVLRGPMNVLGDPMNPFSRRRLFSAARRQCRAARRLFCAAARYVFPTWGHESFRRRVHCLDCRPESNISRTLRDGRDGVPAADCLDSWLRARPAGGEVFYCLMNVTVSAACVDVLTAPPTVPATLLTMATI